MKKYYETDRLILKVLNKTYSKEVLDYYVRNKEFLEEWEPAREVEFYTRKYQEKQLDMDSKSVKSGEAFKLWIFKKGENKTIGYFAFNNIVRGIFLSCFLGYKLDGDEIRKGYMSEALKKGIDIAFRELGLHRIEANIMPKNKASLALAQKLNFYNEGLARKYLKIDGQWEDHIHMVLLNEEK